VIVAVSDAYGAIFRPEGIDIPALDKHVGINRKVVGFKDGEASTNEQLLTMPVDVLIPAADEVITITDSAAEEIQRRWAVSASVLPHPHAVDFVRMRRDRPGPHRGPFVVGAHLGSLRLPLDPVAMVSALASAAAGLDGVRLDVRVHDHLLDSDSTRYDPVTIKEIDRVVSAAGGTLRAHRPMTDAQLWDHLFSLDASFVPPLHGSHSIWPEACFDLGTHVIMPAGSHAAAQRPGVAYTSDNDGLPNVDSLRQAIEQARNQDSLWRADPAARWAERVRIAESLRTTYEKLLNQSR